MTADKVRKHFKDKRLAGLCGWGGCRVHTGDAYYCPQHKRARAQIVAARREREKERARAD